MKKPEQMTKPELIRCVKALEQRAPTAQRAFEHERLLHELRSNQAELETQNRELREAQLLLEVSRDRYADLYDFAPVGYVSLDDRSVIRDINLTAAGMLGVERPRLVGTPFTLYVAREDLAVYGQYISGLTGRHEAASLELRLVRKGEKPVPVMMQTARVYDAETKGFLRRAALTDITLRHQAEQALREANEFGKQVIAGAEAGIVVCDRQGRFVVWNPFMEQITGYQSNEVLGRPALQVFPFLREQHFEKFFARALAGEVFEAADNAFDLPEKGKRGWTAARFAPWRDTRLGILGTIVAVRDITERKRLEKEILEISDREQQRIGQDLHDGLGQQLTGLEMKCFLLLEDLAAEDWVARRGQLQEETRQMSQALRECVTMTRSLARGLVPVDLKANGLMDALKQLALHTDVPGKIECRLVCRAPVPLVNSQTAGHLYRIAQEAVNNALKHSQTQRIDIHLAHEQGVLRLCVNDDGRGLPTNRKSKSGMGLEVMRHRAHVIGATLEIDSKPRQGVRVTCVLPMENEK